MFEPRLVIRRATEADVESLATLMRRFYAFNEEFDPAMEVTGDIKRAALEVARARITSSDIILVASYEGRLVGYVYGSILENPLLARRKVGVLKELYVSPEERGRGVATALIESAMNELAKMGIHYMAVEFPSRNVVAQKFYEKLGFRPYMSVYLKEV
ncbi:MAG: GNAT family N-acetyltransferase [Acidilobaceae archaeon]|jgi:ribosomal protein S18 acetylase RimI-like enzyme